MSLLTNLTQAQIDANKMEIDGKVLSRPALLVTDGTALIYAVDVDIGEVVCELSRGRIVDVAREAQRQVQVVRLDPLRARQRRLQERHA